MPSQANDGNSKFMADIFVLTPSPGAQWTTVDRPRRDEVALLLGHRPVLKTFRRGGHPPPIADQLGLKRTLRNGTTQAAVLSLGGLANKALPQIGLQAVAHPFLGLGATLSLLWRTIPTRPRVTKSFERLGVVSRRVGRRAQHAQTAAMILLISWMPLAFLEMAFPKDSLNNILGGSGPLNTRPDHKTFMGQGEDEAFRDFAASREKTSSSANATVFDPRRASIVHGDESLGLGTSTFLEGTPVARTTIQRREAERAQDTQDNPLQRKKSLAQRFRSTKRGPREGNAGRAFSTDGTPIASRPRGNGNERPGRQFEEYDGSRNEEDMISVRRKAPPMPGSPPSPRDDFERRSTSDAAYSMTDAPKHSHSATGSDDVSKPTSSGLLARVKSLKGGRRAPPPPPTRDS
ncbi:membrane associated protein pal1 [Grosmannia clavigera kw1407]|uniref:Membrane associated protein pal1 n=1 Tax=Grosmannia clavigera (strain kw1407 / UAMH 11150) TaxID=655863 RepID=F0XJ47_GROCL|nr:membrane associated protein pal1 [Grosmannia clavigera kw1407]EFX02111.1 membrane associated protein pal1 [Grosmannia clavigera kw1407]